MERVALRPLLVELGEALLGAYCLWRGWVTMRTLKDLPLEWVFRMAVKVTLRIAGEEAARRHEARIWNPRSIRIYGLTWLMAGAGNFLYGCFLLLAWVWLGLRS